MKSVWVLVLLLKLRHVWVLVLFLKLKHSSLFFILRVCLLALPPCLELSLDPEKAPHELLKGFFTGGEEHSLQYRVKECLHRWWKRLEVDPREPIRDFFDDVSDNHLGA